VSCVRKVTYVVVNPDCMTWQLNSHQTPVNNNRFLGLRGNRAALLSVTAVSQPVKDNWNAPATAYSATSRKVNLSAVKCLASSIKLGSTLC
jgi:hypothetical protein